MRLRSRCSSCGCRRRPSPGWPKPMRRSTRTIWTMPPNMFPKRCRLIPITLKLWLCAGYSNCSGNSLNRRPRTPIAPSRLIPTMAPATWLWVPSSIARKNSRRPCVRFSSRNCSCPMPWQGYFESSKALLQLGKFQPALQQVNKALALGDAVLHPEFHLVKGYAYVGLRTYGAALGEFEQYLSHAPNGPYAAEARSLLDKVRPLAASVTR